MDPNNSGVIAIGLKRGREAISDDASMSISDEEVSPRPPAQPTNIQPTEHPMSFRID